MYQFWMIAYRWLCNVFMLKWQKESMTFGTGINECLSMSKDAIELARAIEQRRREGVEFNIKQIEDNLKHIKANLPNMRLE